MTTQRKVEVRVVLLIALALLALHLPGMGLTKAYAADKSITGLGTGSIKNPVNGNTDGLTGWTGSYVYYGKYNGSPVKYRVLDKASADFGVSGGSLLLDCDSTLYKALFENSGSGSWERSTIKSGLNAELFLTKEGVFTSAEKAAIAESKKANKKELDGSGGSELVYTALTGEQIFLLDSVEATRSSYGYTDWGNGHNNYVQEAATRKKDGVIKAWWVRSPLDGYDNVGGHVVTDGKIISVGFNGNIGVSPAFNVNLSCILFSSEIPSESGSYKLTLKDKNLSIRKDGDITRDGKTITVPYSAAGTHNRISVLMTDKAWTESGAAVKYYRELSSSKQFILPDGYNTNWKVYILAEQVNGDKETDYASEPVEITIPAEVVEKKPEETEQNIISDSGEKDEAGSTFYPLCARQKKVKKNSITFTWNKVKGATSYVVYGYLCGTCKSQKLTTTAVTSYTWKKLKKGTYYKIYVVAKNGADVISISKKVHVATSGKRYGNATSVSVKKKSVKLKKGKTCKLGASVRKKGKVKQHRRLSYESTNPAVATVNSSGKIKAVGKGTCYVYAYTQNGLFKRVKVTVKK